MHFAAGRPQPPPLCLSPDEIDDIDGVERRADPRLASAEALGEELLDDIRAIPRDRRVVARPRRSPQMMFVCGRKVDGLVRNPTRGTLREQTPIAPAGSEGRGGHRNRSRCLVSGRMHPR